MGTYLINGEVVDIPISNPTAGDLKKYADYDKSSWVQLTGITNIFGHLQDNETIPENVTTITIFRPKGGPNGPDPYAFALATVGTMAALAQVFLMIVDMWSRKSEKKESDKTKSTSDTAWDEVKQIRVMMDNGKWVQFDFWLSDPDKVRQFIGVFNRRGYFPGVGVPNPPKPEKVVFLLKNDSKVEIYLFNHNSEKQLEDFLQFLKQ